MKPKQTTEMDDEEDIVEAVDDTEEVQVEDRKKDYGEFKYVQAQLASIYDGVIRGFEDKTEQANVIDECWDIYNCTLNANQKYVGTAQAYVPIVHDAMNARATRFVNNLFPVSGRYAEITGGDGTVPYELISLMDYYVRTTNLRTNIVPAMIRGGDISGQYALYIDWCSKKRNVVSKKKVAEMQTETGTPVEGSPEYDDVEYEEITEEGPSVMVIDARDLCVLPATVDTIEDASIVAIALRFSKDKIKEKIRKGEFNKAAGKQLLASFDTMDSNTQPNTARKALAAAGVRMDSKKTKEALVYQVWTELKIRGEYRLMVTHFGGEDCILSCKRNPYWCDRIPVISQAVEKEAGSHWGKSQVQPVTQTQYAANDAVNMGLDSAQYALLPIVMTNPEKNPRVGSMVMAMAAIWETNPADTQFATFPALWKDALALVAACKDQVMQTLSVNPAMMPQGGAGKKPTQAQIAQEQQVALESTNDPVNVITAGVLNKVLEWFYEMDYQYRTQSLTIKQWGQVGLQANMDQVQPFQVRQRYDFRWYGSEAVKAAQQVQQMISFTNILRSIPPEQLNGRKVDLGPVLEHISEVTYGPRIAPKVLIDQRHQLTMDPTMENEMLNMGFPVQVQPMDNDMQHLQLHMEDFKMTGGEHGDVTGYKRIHILEHIKAAKEKAAMAQGALPAPGGMPGSPGGAAPGLPGQPRPGATAQAPTGIQNPPGAIPPDQMVDPNRMPRRPMG